MGRDKKASSPSKQGHKSLQAPTRVVVSSFSGSRWKFVGYIRRHKYISLIILIIILAVIAGLIWWRASYINSPSHGSTKTTTGELPTQVGQLVRTKRYQAAQTVIQRSTADDETKQLLSAAVDLNAGQYAQALATYQAIAKQYGLTESTAVSIAQTAVKAKQPGVARDYYQRAIKLLEGEPHLPGVQSTITRLQHDLAGVKQ